VCAVATKANEETLKTMKKCCTYPEELALDGGVRFSREMIGLHTNNVRKS